MAAQAAFDDAVVTLKSAHAIDSEWKKGGRADAAQLDEALALYAQSLGQFDLALGDGGLNEKTAAALTKKRADVASRIGVLEQHRSGGAPSSPVTALKLRAGDGDTFKDAVATLKEGAALDGHVKEGDLAHAHNAVRAYSHAIRLIDLAVASGSCKPNVQTAMEAKVTSAKKRIMVLSMKAADGAALREALARDAAEHPALVAAAPEEAAAPSASAPEAAGNLEEMRPHELKRMLRNAGLDDKGPKAELIARLEAFQAGGEVVPGEQEPTPPERDGGGDRPRWCKKCQLSFDGSSCGKGHPNFMYTQNLPPEAQPPPRPPKGGAQPAAEEPVSPRPSVGSPGPSARRASVVALSQGAGNALERWQAAQPTLAEGSEEEEGDDNDVLAEAVAPAAIAAASEAAPTPALAPARKAKVRSSSNDAQEAVAELARRQAAVAAAAKAKRAEKKATRLAAKGGGAGGTAVQAAAAAAEEEAAAAVGAAAAAVEERSQPQQRLQQGHSSVDSVHSEQSEASEVSVEADAEPASAAATAAVAAAVQAEAAQMAARIREMKAAKAKAKEEKESRGRQAAKEAEGKEEEERKRRQVAEAKVQEEQEAARAAVAASQQQREQKREEEADRKAAAVAAREAQDAAAAAQAAAAREAAVAKEGAAKEAAAAKVAAAQERAAAAERQAVVDAQAETTERERQQAEGEARWREQLSAAPRPSLIGATPPTLAEGVAPRPLPEPSSADGIDALSSIGALRIGLRQPALPLPELRAQRDAATKVWRQQLAKRTVAFPAEPGDAELVERSDTAALAGIRTALQKDVAGALGVSESELLAMNAESDD